MSLHATSARAIELPAAVDAVQLGRSADARARVARRDAADPLLALEPRPGGAPEQLRVAILAPRVDVGGGARILLEHANRLHDRGHEVVVLAHFPRPTWFDLRAEYLHVPAGTDLCAALPACDLVVCGYWDQVLAARAENVAPVVHFEQGDFHLFEELRPAVQDLVQDNLAAADVTTTVSAQVAAVHAERYGTDGAGVVHNAVDTDVFGPDGARPEGHYVLCVGWDGNAFKGMDDVRRLWARLQAERPGLQLVWVTPKPPVEPMGHVVVSPDQPVLAALYRGAAAYLCASHYESFPLPPLEAMACGAPVVTTANVGVLEYARDADNALIVPIGDVDAMAAALGRVLDEPEVAARLVEGARRTADSFRWEVIIDGLEERYRSVAAERIAVLDGPAWERPLAAEPVDAGAAARLEHALATSPAAEILVPVVRPGIEGHELVSWEAVARRDGGRGSVRVLARHRGAEPRRLDYQDAIDALVAEQPQRALELFEAAERAAGDDRARVGALLKWRALALVELFRTDEALDVLARGMREFGDNPDYTYLAAVVAPLAGRPVDLDHAQFNLGILGEGTRYDDWFAAPGELLAARR